MDYEQFREQLAEEVQKNLYEKGDVDVNITFNHVEKMNESYDVEKDYYRELMVCEVIKWLHI